MADPETPPPAPPPDPPPDYSGPPDATGLPGYARPAPGGWGRLVLGLLLTAALLVGVVVAWPDGGDDGDSDASTPRSPTTAGSPLGPGNVPTPPSGGDEGDVDLFRAGAPEALAQLLAAAGDPAQLFEIAVYPTYLIVAYRDPAEPSHIDRRIWRSGAVDAPSANPIDDRVDAGTEPGLFGATEVDLARLAGMTADAATRYDLPVDVSHVLIDRFLPFDERVLVRVYATPSDGRSGGGYVTYAPDGTFVDVCC